MDTGCYTALITPFKNDSIDNEGLEKLIDFQVKNGISGILAVGTTGESPTLTWDEHNAVIEKVREKTRDKSVCIAGTGSNNTRESLSATRHAADIGVDAVLLVDPYYNGPSSLEIRKEYIEPIARKFPKIQIIPYVIPGRTGTQLLPEDLAILSREFGNVRTVKEATGNLENMKRTRACCGEDYTIFSGDDGMTCQMMTDPGIKGAGVISVASNVAPGAVVKMVGLLAQGDISEARKLMAAIEPLFSLVTVKTMEKTPYGEVSFRGRNPLGIKALMSVLGMPSGGCRQPMGRLTKNALEKVLDVARNIQMNHPEVFKPAADFFGIDMDARLENPSNWEGLCYESY